MALILFLLFLLTPIIEIAIFIKVGSLFGLWPTLAIVIITAVLGAALWRAQGLSTLARAQDALNRGELPLREVTDGAFLLVAGALLLTPGFFTDTVGFLLLVPPFRHWLAGMIYRHLRANMDIHVVNADGPDFGPGRNPGSGPSGGRHGGTTIEGEVREQDE